MSLIVIHPSRLSGVVTMPESKSQAHRALILSHLSGAALPTLDCESDDVLATIACLDALDESKDLLDCKSSAATLRLMLPICAARGRDVRFIGTEQLASRPILPLLHALGANGMHYDQDRLPIHISGQLRAAEYLLPGDVSSQFVSGLLMALPLLVGDSTITLTGALQSRGYVLMTCQMMAQFGIHIEIGDFGLDARGSRLVIPGNQTYTPPKALAIEGDWSAAANYIVANELGANIEIHGLDQHSMQPDRAIESLLRMRSIDVSNCPDLAPILTAFAACQAGETCITGAARLRYKESDRLSSIHAMLRALGVQVRMTEDALFITGGRVQGGIVDCMNDHRIAMAAAILATRAEGAVHLLGADCVRKSHPRFFEDYRMLGGALDESIDG